MGAYESALKLDAALPNPFFSDPKNRAVHFHVGFTQLFWGVNSYYIRRSQDSDAAIEYRMRDINVVVRLIGRMS